MLAETLEQVQSCDSKRTLYIRLVLATLAIIVLAKTAWVAGFGALPRRDIVDFDDFYIVAQRVWLGDADLAYQLDKLLQMQIDGLGVSSFMPWTYPPQFDVLIAPLALLPVGLAYLVFTAATFVFFLAALRTIAATNFVLVLLVLFPALVVTLSCGQNGFLTAGLIGLVCINVLRHDASSQVRAGLALAAMVIKPHLAVAMAVYLLITRRWTVLATAVLGVLASSALCTLLLGPQIWTALLGAIRDSSVYLAHGDYPLFRMLSFYAAVRPFGVPPAFAFWGQAGVAGLALLSIFIAVARKAAPRTALGLTALVSVMISPYAYDYDLPIAGIGLALLLTDLMKAASPGERSAIYALIVVAGAYGMLQTVIIKALGPDAGTHHPYIPAIGGMAMIALLALVLRILLRPGLDRQEITDQAAARSVPDRALPAK